MLHEIKFFQNGQKKSIVRNLDGRVKVKPISGKLLRKSKAILHKVKFFQNGQKKSIVRNLDGPVKVKLIKEPTSKTKADWSVIMLDADFKVACVISNGLTKLQALAKVKRWKERKRQSILLPVPKAVVEACGLTISDIVEQLHPRH